MKQEDLYIIQRISRRFTCTSAYHKYAELVSEINCWSRNQQIHRPDLSFYTGEQIRKSAVRKDILPAFIIEIISEEESILKLGKKLIECFHGGVQVVWRIIPDIRTVSVYTSPKTVVICTDDDVINAAPVIPDLTLTVNELLKI